MTVPSTNTSSASSFYGNSGIEYSESVAVSTIYLGAFSSAPTLDNSGNALVAGQLYWDTTETALNVYTGSEWVSYLPSELVVSEFNGRLGDVVPETGDYSFSQIGGNISVDQMNNGTSAASTTFWRGDGTWAGVSGANGGTVTSVAMTVPTGLAVSGGPITGGGTFLVTWSGTIPNAQLPNPSATALGGVQSASAPTNEWMTGISTAGVPTFLQPHFTNISGSVLSSQLPNPSLTTLGGVQAVSGVSHQWIASINTSGVPQLSQPAFTDISGTASNSQLSNMSAGTVKANPTGSSAAPTDWSIGASNSVNSSSIPGLSGTQFYIYRAPSATDSTSQQATLRVDRNPTYTGGTPGNVFNAILAYQNVGANVADYQWSFLGEMQNSATAGQNVAIAGAAYANSTGPTWAMDLVMRDTVSTTSASVNCVTAELDLFANGTDTGGASGRRVLLDLVLGMQNPSGAAVHASRGIEFSGNDGATDDIYDTGILYSNTAGYGTGIDMSAGTFSTAALLSPGYTLDPNGNSISASTTAPTVNAQSALVGSLASAPSMSNNGALFYSGTNGGATVQGNGATNDVVIKNKNGATVLAVPTGTQNVNVLDFLATNNTNGAQTLSSSGSITSGIVLVTGAATLTFPSSPATGTHIWIKMAAAVATVISAASNVVPLNSTTAGTAIFSSGNLTKFAHLIFDGTNWQMMEAA